MARTVRRKNAWNKNVYVSSEIDWWDRNRFPGLTDEQIVIRKHYWYHGETPDNWNGKKWMKAFSKYTQHAHDNRVMVKLASSNNLEDYDYVFADMRVLRDIFDNYQG